MPETKVPSNNFIYRWFYLFLIPFLLIAISHADAEEASKESKLPRCAEAV